MAWSESDLTALKRMYARGVLESERDGRRLKFATMSELRTAISDVEAEVNATAGVRDARVVRSVYGGKGS